MDSFKNNRIILPFEKDYEGRNQFIFTDGIDDCFLINGDTGPSLYSLTEAIAEYGKFAKYDFVIIVTEDLKLQFPVGTEAEFDSLVRGDSTHLVEAGHKSRKFQPAPRNNSAGEAAGRPQNASVAAALEKMDSQASSFAGLNNLERITKILQVSSKRVLVIFPYPEKMLDGQNDGTMLKKMECIAKNWRNITQKAHPDSRTVLIINPHRLEQFRQTEQFVSCFDHSCQVFQIGLPDREEMRAWLNKYRRENAIDGTDREALRVVLTGQTHGDANLNNFVGWVQGFFLKNPDDRTWKALLASANQGAAQSKEDLLEELHGMIGLKSVKEVIDKIVLEAEKKGNTSNSAYHMFFLGNPGTGKTVVARLVAKLFWALELRSKPDFVEVKIQDIVGEFNEGEAIQSMKNKIQEAMGGVLFVDEAYLFAESEWGKKAFQVLMTEMEDHRDNLTVILAGYEERLQELKDVNPGLDSRIPYKLEFDDYDADEKMKIFEYNLRKEKSKGTPYKLTPKSKEKLKRILERCDDNGRGVRNIFEATIKNVQQGNEILPEHIRDPHEIDREGARKILEEIDKDFIGMKEMKSQLAQFFEEICFNAERAEKLNLKSEDCRVSYRLRFTGPPGTGKTTIARYMGRLFHAMGVTATDGFREVGATTLKGAYVGHAQQNVNNIFHANKDKVIFIDEIYSLYNPQGGQDDSFGREAIDTLVRCLTAPEYRDTVVIVAGYKELVDKFMEANPGLASRIPTEIEFSNYTAEECVSIFRMIAVKKHYVLAKGCDEALARRFAKIIEEDERKKPSEKTFGNARTVNAEFDAIVKHLCHRLMTSDKRLTDKDYQLISTEDI